jgi:hypothetical protein
MNLGRYRLERQSIRQKHMGVLRASSKRSKRVYLFLKDDTILMVGRKNTAAFHKESRRHMVPTPTCTYISRETGCDQSSFGMLRKNEVEPKCFEVRVDSHVIRMCFRTRCWWTICIKMVVM